MFAVEYELQEPSVGNRAFDTDAVEAMFVDTKHPKAVNGTIQSPIIRNNGAIERYVFEEPTREGDYIIAADWAKEQDYTVISVFRYDQDQMELVAYHRGQRVPWPVMVGWFNDLQQHYEAKGIHDATGVGGVVRDLIDSRVRGFLMTGRQRNEMLTEYIAAVERGLVKVPRVTSAYSAHKYASFESIYNIGTNVHLPDEICSFALAWLGTGRKAQMAGPITLPRMGQYERDEDIPALYVPGSPWHDIGGKTTYRDFGVTSIDHGAGDPSYGGFNLDL